MWSTIAHNYIWISQAEGWVCEPNTIKIVHSSSPLPSGSLPAVLATHGQQRRVTTL